MLLNFMLQKNLLNPDQVLDIAIEQIESLPSLLGTIRKEKVLGDDELIKLFLKAALEGSSFYTFFERHSGLTRDDFAILLKKQNLEGKSLGEIIVSKGYMPQDKWDQSLRDYLSSGEKEKFEARMMSSPSAVSPVSSPPSSPAPSPPSSSAPSSPVISAAALESLKQVQGLDSTEVEKLEEQVEVAPSAKEKSPPYSKEFFEKYNEETQSEMLVVANRFRMKGRKKDLISFHKYLSTVLTLIKLNNYTYFEKLITPYESLLSKIVNESLEVFERWNELTFDILELSWELRTQLFEKKSEEDILKEENIKKRYIDIVKEILSYLKR